MVGKNIQVLQNFILYCFGIGWPEQPEEKKKLHVFTDESYKEQ